MRTTKHGGAQSPRKHRRAVGLPLALLAVGVVVCLAVALLNQGGAAPRAADVPVTAAESSVPPDAAAPGVTSEASTKAKQPVTSPPPPRRTPTASATSKPPASTRSPRATASTPTRSPRTTASTPRTTSAGSLAGRIKPGVRYRGVATAYEAADGNGACSFGPADDMMIAAMNETDYESAKACGAHVLVRAANGASITVRIVNVCPLPCAPGQLDLSQQAFAKLAELKVGRIPITWTLLSPASSGHDLHPLQGRVQSVVVWHPGDRSPQPVGEARGQRPPAAGASCSAPATTTSSPPTAADAAKRSGSPTSTVNG